MRLSNIQLLRALAALMVVFHHMGDAVRSAGTGSWFNSFFQLQQVGAAGVDLFFVISGFIMIHVAGRSFGNRHAAPHFLQRRLLRIFPVYWVATGVVIAGWLSGAVFRSLQMSPGYILGSLLCVPMARHPIIDQGWSLSFEIYFYLLLALSFYLFSRPATFIKASFVFFAGSVSLGFFLPKTGNALLDFLTNPLLLEFWMGALIGHLWRPSPAAWVSGRLAPALTVAGAVWLASTLFSGILWEMRLFAWGIPSALLLAGVSLLPAGRSRPYRIATALGDSSYSLYLTHGYVSIVIAGVIKHLGPTAIPGDLLIFGGALGSVALGQCFWWAIERPLLAKLSAKPGKAVPSPRHAKVLAG